MPRSRPILAIGIDAADGRLLKRLAAEGMLPSIARLAAAGGWRRVTSPAHIGSGAVWPTFVTGRSPDEHGLFGEYAWRADTMTLGRPTFDRLEPFWSTLAARGRRVAVLDVPFAPVTRRPNLLEIADWGAHDWLGGRRIVSPQSIEVELGSALAAAHPLAAGPPVDSRGPGDVSGLTHVVRACTSGARLRGDLALALLDRAAPDLLLVVFTEAHRASHLLWHTLDPGHPAWSEDLPPLPDEVTNGLAGVLRTIDAQIDRLVATADPAATIVFALHGMQPARGIPAFLGSVLERWEFSVRRPWWRRSAGEHLGAGAKAIKRRVPAWMKDAYYRQVPRTVTMQLAQPSVDFSGFDWTRTRAFALPTDQHGWIRINLAGREAQGLVTSAEYPRLCETLRDRLFSLRSPEGPLAREVFVAAQATGGPPRAIPDLVVHWSPHSWRPRPRVVEPALDVPSVGSKFVAQHDHDGFVLAAGAGVESWPETIDATELGRLISGACELSQPQL